MNATLFKYQLVACGVLGTVLLLEWGVGEIGRRHLRDTLNKNIDSDYQSEPLPSLNLPKLSEHSFNSIVERPLFIEGRKPIPQDTSEDDSEAAADEGQLDDWALIGIYNKNKNKGKRRALFRNQKETGKFLKLYEEQTISGWLLKQIQSDRVILQLGGQQKNVMLRKPREQVKTPMPPKRVAPTAKPATNNSPETKQQ
ncbi:hypothetical protein [Methylomonas sp. MgM2]